MTYELCFIVMENNWDVEREYTKVIEAANINEAVEEAERTEISLRERGWDYVSLEAICDSEGNVIDETKEKEKDIWVESTVCRHCFNCVFDIDCERRRFFGKTAAEALKDEKKLEKYIETLSFIAEGCKHYITNID